MKAQTVRVIIIGAGIGIMMLILLSKATGTAKGIGVILSVILIAMGVIITSPLKKLFASSKEGNMRPDESY